jgi:ABC-type nitrate/sulfonate/bicarbonate transport system substrate-binding protein
MTPVRLNLGFVPLLDCATLVVAAEQGFAAEENLFLNLVRENSWANIRDRVIVGHFHAAQMLGPMTVSSTLGIGHLRIPMIAPMALGLGGNAITVSNRLWQHMVACGAQLGATPQVQGAALRRVLSERIASKEPPLTLAMVYPFSCHNYELRYWLAASGIDPDRDVRLVVIPPPFLVDTLKEGQIDGFCVGEPWNSLAVSADAGVIVMPTTAIWRQSPEKVLGCRASWAEQHPDELTRLIRALYRAALWCDEPGNHAALAELLAEPRFIGVRAEVLHDALAGRLRFAAGETPASVPDLLSFARDLGTFPWASHALWFYSQMVRWHQCVQSKQNAEAARATYRPDLYRAAVQTLGASVPMTDFKAEHPSEASGTFFSAEGFFDGQVFDPADLDDYIAALIAARPAV